VLIAWAYVGVLKIKHHMHGEGVDDRRKTRASDVEKS